MATAADGLTEYERKYFTPAAQRGVRAIRALDDVALLALARCAAFATAKGAGDDPGAAAAYVTVVAATGPGTNPLWVTSTAAASAYERGVMEPEEMDRIVDE